MQGVAIVRDSQRGVYVNVVKACGSNAKGEENTFGKVCSEMEAASKKPATTKKFKGSYPFKRPASGMRGGIKGVYSDLEMLVGMAIDTSKSTECLNSLLDRENEEQDGGHNHREQEIQACLKHVYVVS